MAWKPTSQTGTTSSVAIHAALIPTSTGAAILYWGWGSQKTFLYDATPGIDDLDRTNVAGGNPITSQDLGHVFCGSESFLADGRLLAAGGVVNQNIDHGGFAHDSGERRSYIYSPLANTWTGEHEIDDLNFQPDSNSRGGGRWYPTILTLGNGEGFASGGHPFIGVVLDDDTVDDTTGDNSPFPASSGPRRHNNNTPERYSPTANAWTLIVNESTSHDDQLPDEYPRIHLAPSGHVFYSTRAKGFSRFYDPFSGAYTNDVVNPEGHSEYFAGSNATAVMLPILPGAPDDVWVLACGGSQAQRINLMANVPLWLNSGSSGKPVRNHACCVLLPTGQVFLTGGVGSDGVAADPEDPSVVPQPTTAFRTPELYTPAINAAFTAYTGTEKWESVDDATVVRGYHGVALLLPDGRVWTAGSTDRAGATMPTDTEEDYPNGDPVLDFEAPDEQRIEIWEPPYFAVQNRAVIGDDVPASVGYGMSIVFTVTSGTPARVALMRCGSMTHAFDSDQRYVGLTFTRAGTTVTASIPTTPNVLPPGMYMLWVIDTNGNPCREAKFVRVCDQLVRFDVNRSTFSEDETTALQDADGTTTFSEVLHAHFECFRPQEIDFPTTSPSTKLRWDSSSGASIATSSMVLSLNRTIVEDPSLPADVAQRITFVFDLVIKDIAVFDELPGADRSFNVHVGIGNFSADTLMSLTTDPNPYMIDVEGDNPSYLSADVRVFKIKPGQTKFGSVTMGEQQAPLTFLDALLDQMNAEADAETDQSQHTFAKLPRDQDDPDGVMELSQLVDGEPGPLGMQLGGDPIFNFAIAKVRYVSQSTEIHDLKVFFRLFNTVGTALEYDTDITYRRDGTGADAIPLLGRIGPSIISIPFFGSDRVTPLDKMEDQTDERNTMPTLAPKGASESIGYFGCWLDINQTAKHIPPFPADDGPYTSNLPFLGPVSIQELVRNYHQCLIAEVFFGPDPIPDHATPPDHENLAQRNLAVSKSGNPGSKASRTVQTTCVIKPSVGATKNYVQTYVSPNRRQRFDLRRRRALLPDELMLVSHDLPAGSKVTLYSPKLDAREVIRLAAQRSSPVRLVATDPNTIQFVLKQAAYVPLPGNLSRNLASLLSVELPAGVTKGQVFTLVAHQYSGQYPRKLIGSFQLRIPVEDESSLLVEEVRKLSVLRHIFKSIATTDPWHAVFERYLGQIGDRVRAFGGDPDRVVPSPTGSLPARKPTLRHFEGKVSRVDYDCFGDFRGFELETCDARHRFETCEPKIEQVALRACKERWTLRVVTRDDRIAGLSVICC